MVFLVAGFDGFVKDTGKPYYAAKMGAAFPTLFELDDGVASRAPLFASRRRRSGPSLTGCELRLHQIAGLPLLAVKRGGLPTAA